MTTRDEPLLALKAPEHGHLRDAGAARDVVDRRAADPVLGEHLERRRRDAVDGRVLARRRALVELRD